MMGKGRVEHNSFGISFYFAGYCLLCHDDVVVGILYPYVERKILRALLRRKYSCLLLLIAPSLFSFFLVRHIAGRFLEGLTQHHLDSCHTR